MRVRLTRFTMAAAMLLAAASAVQAQSPAYSFESIVAPNGPDGFFGLGAAVSQDTIGVTDGRFSLKYLAGSAGFVGARTETVIPATLNDPPGVDYVLFDMTLVEAFAGGFADIGVTVFGHALNDPGGASFGNQVQFADTVAIAGKAAGTYLDQRIDLDVSQGPFRFGETFNQIVGPGPTDLTVISAFQFYISKTGGIPATIYLDNVRFVSIPEPSTLALVALSGVALTTLRRHRAR
jgi:hypothetical protein